AECLIAFVRAHLPAEGGGEDEILVPGTSPLPPKHGPAALLNARHEVVGFVGRDRLLEDLRGWWEGEGRVAGRLMQGGGGMGRGRGRDPRAGGGAAAPEGWAGGAVECAA